MQLPIQHVATLTAVRVTEPAEAQRELTGRPVGSCEGVSNSKSEPCQATLDENNRTANLSKMMKPAIRKGIMGRKPLGVLRGRKGLHASKGQPRDLRDPAKWGREPERSKGMHNLGLRLCKGVGDAHSSREVSNDHGAKGHYLDDAKIETRRTD